MAMANFDVTEHTIPTCHIREYPRATIDGDDDELYLAVKQYTPKRRFEASNTITIIGAHANGFPKELYEPLWDDLLTNLQENHNTTISNIFIADVAHQGASGVLNEDLLGNDPSWADHPRDLLLMVNHFRRQIVRPVFGIGHSMGGNNLVNLSLMHPRLLAGLVLVDPVVQRYPSVGGNVSPARASVGRREIWLNRKEAEEKFKRSRFYASWDPRVLERWVKYGLRELPTRLHPQLPQATSTPPPVNADPGSGLVQLEKDDVPVTLTTTKHQEVLTFLRANLPTPSHPHPSTHPNPTTHPDVPLDSPPITPFYSPVPIATFHRLPHLRPPVLYIFGSESFLSTPVLKADKLAHTGTGVGGSGGVKKGRVRGVTFKGVGHLIPMEVVGRTAGACAGWIGSESERWRGLEVEERRAWRRVPRRERARFSAEYERWMKSGWEDELVDRAKGEKSKL